MDTCQHCWYSPGAHLVEWHYPDESYKMAALLCEACSQLVLVRHHRGHLIIDEYCDWQEWLQLWQPRLSIPTDPAVFLTGFAP